jgi:hypothetical protein
MAKKYMLTAAAISAFLAAQSVEAPGILYQFNPPRERVMMLAENSLEKIARENKEEFLRALYKDFPYPREVLKIIEHAKIEKLDPALLMAIRLAENGKDSVAYGVMPGGKIKQIYEKEEGYIKDGKFYAYNDIKEKQLHWAARTVRYYLDEFEKDPKNKDFISYLAKKYSPIEGDEKGLNKYWEGNVRHFYNTFKKSFSI